MSKERTMTRIARTIAATALFLIAAGMFGSGVYQLGAGIVTGTGSALVWGIILMVAAVVPFALFGGAMPKQAKRALRISQDKGQPVSSTITALVIPANPAEPITVSPMSDTLAMAQSVVGGYIETVGVGVGWLALANEDGKAVGLPYNARATHIMGFMSGHNLNDPIVGAVLVTGSDADGNVRSVPPQVSAQMLKLAEEISR